LDRLCFSSASTVSTSSFDSSLTSSSASAFAFLLALSRLFDFL
jgi:hypothetical protein